MGLIQLAYVIGALLVGLLSKWVSINNAWKWVLGIALFFIPMSLAVTPMALKTGFWLPYVMFLASNIIMIVATMILNIFAIVRIQSQTPGENLGKVMAIIQAVAQCVAPFGQILYGAAFEGFETLPYIPLAIAGIVTAGTALIWRVMLRGVEFKEGAHKTV
jgi:MFS family permease